MSFATAARLAASLSGSSLSDEQVFSFVLDAAKGVDAGSPARSELRTLAAATAKSSGLSPEQFAAATAGARALLRQSETSPNIPLLLLGPAQWIRPEMLAWATDIEHAIVELVASAKTLVTLMAPFGTADAIASAVRPLSALGGAAHLRLLTAGDPGHVETLERGLRATLPDSVLARTTLHLRSPGHGPWPHAKLLLVDGVRGYLGSANFTTGGLGRYFEIGVTLSVPQAAAIENYLVPTLLAEVFTEQRLLSAS